MIREATCADVQAIAEVHVQSWRESYRGLVPDAALAALDVVSCAHDWATRLQELTSSQACFVWLEEGAVAGFVHAGPAKSEEFPAHGEIYAIYLLDCAKGKGVGRALMERAARRLREAGFRSVCLWFLRDNPAGGFYQRFGGRVVAEKLYVRPGFVLPSLGCVWDDIDALIAALAGGSL